MIYCSLTAIGSAKWVMLKKTQRTNKNVNKLIFTIFIINWFVKLAVRNQQFIMRKVRVELLKLIYNGKNWSRKCINFWGLSEASVML